MTPHHCQSRLDIQYTGHMFFINLFINPGWVNSSPHHIWCICNAAWIWKGLSDACMSDNMWGCKHQYVLVTQDLPSQLLFVSFNSVGAWVIFIQSTGLLRVFFFFMIQSSNMKLQPIVWYDSVEDSDHQDVHKCHTVPLMNVCERGKLTVIAVHHLNR